MDEAMTEGTDKMDCAQFEDIVHELDRPGTQGAQLRDVALNHAESCESCGALLTETESLDFALLKLADESQRIATPARIEAGLLQEFRRTKAITSRRRLQRQIAVIGVAAALFLALGISLRHRAETSRTAGITQVAASIPATHPVSETSSGASSATSTATSSATDAGSGQQAQAQLNAVAQTTKVLNGSDGTEVAQDFTPLPYSDGLSMEEGGAVVRVILSRAALASFGVPITAAESSEQISADLLVSADGTPEAIRLVSQNVN